MMNKLFYSLLFTLISCSTTFVPQSFYWSASTKESAQIQMLGTIHMDMGELSDDIKQAIDNADVVFVEMTEQDQREFYQALYRDFLNDTDKSKLLPNSLSPKAMNNIRSLYANKDIFEVANKLTGGKNIDQMNAQTFTAILQAITFGEWVSYLDGGRIKKFEHYYRNNSKTIMTLYNDARSASDIVDQKIERYAMSQGKKVISLDSRRTVLQVAEEIELHGHKNSVKYLEFFFGDEKNLLQEDIVSTLERINQISEAYIKGYENVISKLAHELESQPLGSIMLKNRNVSWLNKLTIEAERPENSKIFVAAGVSHFYGEYSLNRLLEKNNYYVRHIGDELKEKKKPTKRRPVGPALL